MNCPQCIKEVQANVLASCPKGSEELTKALIQRLGEWYAVLGYSDADHDQHISELSFFRPPQSMEEAQATLSMARSMRGRRSKRKHG